MSTARAPWDKGLTQNPIRKWLKVVVLVCMLAKGSTDMPMEFTPLEIADTLPIASMSQRTTKPPTFESLATLSGRPCLWDAHTPLIPWRREPLRLQGGGRAWIRKTIKKARKQERQRKKRNIDGTNLKASVKLDNNYVSPAVLLNMEMHERANQWIMAGRNASDMPRIMPAAEPAAPALPEPKKRALVDHEGFLLSGEDGDDAEDAGSSGLRLRGGGKADAESSVVSSSLDESDEEESDDERAVVSAEPHVNLRSDAGTKTALATEQPAGGSAPLTTEAGASVGAEEEEASSEVEEDESEETESAADATVERKKAPAAVTDQNADDVLPGGGGAVGVQPEGEGEEESESQRNKEQSAKDSTEVEEEEEEEVESEEEGSDDEDIQDTEEGEEEEEEGEADVSVYSDDLSSSDVFARARSRKTASRLRLVTGQRNNPAAFGIFFDVVSRSDRPITIRAIATASHHLCMPPIDVAVFTSPGGCERKEENASQWEEAGRAADFSGLPQIWDTGVHSARQYGELPLHRPLTLPAGATLGVCVHSSAVSGVVLRALKRVGAEEEDRPGSGARRFQAGDITDEDEHIALRAGRVVALPLEAPFESECTDHYGFCGTVKYALAS